MKIINFEPREETPKACPFCGNEQIEILFNFKTLLYRVHCLECYAKTAPSHLREKAIKNWNQRV